MFRDLRLRRVGEPRSSSSSPLPIVVVSGTHSVQDFFFELKRPASRFNWHPSGPSIIVTLPSAGPPADGTGIREGGRPAVAQ
jgi:hypothetical protein